MGFRDLQCLNIAMLLKQCWRLISDPDSLCASVLRAKYYPSGDILNCQLKKGSSYTWQSIWAGIQSFKRGHMWRVGDGSLIDTWDDPWIPSSPNMKIATRRGNTWETNTLDEEYPNSLIRSYTRVSELIDTETNTWDEELIREFFLVGGCGKNSPYSSCCWHDGRLRIMRGLYRLFGMRNLLIFLSV